MFSMKNVVIVGAGPVGLSLSIFLSNFGIKNVLIEKSKNFERQKHPQAHFLNFRTMEIFKTSIESLYPKIIAEIQPLSNWRDFVYCSSVLGKEFARVDNFSGVNSLEKLKLLSPVSVAHLSQSKLHPLLLEHAVEVLGAELWTGATVDKIEQSPDTIYVRATMPDGTKKEIESLYLAGCDGAHSAVRRMLGIPLHNLIPGQTPIIKKISESEGLGHLVNIHFSCPDLCAYMPKSRAPAMLYFVFNEVLVAVLVAHNVQEGVWVCQVPFFPPHQSVERNFGNDACVRLIRSAVGLDDLPVQIHSVRTWSMHAAVAQNFQSDSGNAFLVGDAAHQFPPAGGFGLNTGIQDAHNLAWKLKMVLDGHLPKQFLQTYHTERHAIAVQNTNLSLSNYKRTIRVSRALGIDPEHPKLLQKVLGDSKSSFPVFDSSLKFGLAPLKALRVTGHPYGALKLSNLHDVLKNGAGLPLIFPKHDLGFKYICSKNEKAGTETGNVCDNLNFQLLEGHRLPHCVLASPDNYIFSTVDICSQVSSLVEPAGTKCYFVLLVHHAPSLDLHSVASSNPIQYIPFELKEVPIVLFCVKKSMPHSVGHSDIDYGSILLLRECYQKSKCHHFYVEASSDKHHNNPTKTKYTVFEAHDLVGHLGKQGNSSMFSSEIYLIRPDGHIAFKWTLPVA